MGFAVRDTEGMSDLMCGDGCKVAFAVGDGPCAPGVSGIEENVGIQESGGAIRARGGKGQGAAACAKLRPLGGRREEDHDAIVGRRSGGGGASGVTLLEGGASGFGPRRKRFFQGIFVIDFLAGLKSGARATAWIEVPRQGEIGRGPAEGRASGASVVEGAVLQGAMSSSTRTSGVTASPGPSGISDRRIATVSGLAAAATDDHRRACFGQGREGKEEEEKPTAPVERRKESRHDKDSLARKPAIIPGFGRV